MSLESLIKDIYGSAAAIRYKEPVAGGDINEAYHLVLNSGEELFLKENSEKLAGMFAAEAHGLEALQKANGHVPKVIAVGKDERGRQFMLLEFVRSSRPQRGYWLALGHMLGRMHQADTQEFTPEGRFGFHENNYIGSSPQVNRVKSSWLDFYRDFRLGKQMRMAEHYFEQTDRKLCLKLLDHLDDYLAEPAFPSLLHGDLWSGNVMPDSQGAPMLIDPAVYVGHHEADIAMTELFGGFAPDFYDGYHEIIAKDPGYIDRRELYSLYHLLNHLNLFGSSYLSAVRRILKRYVG